MADNDAYISHHIQKIKRYAMNPELFLLAVFAAIVVIAGSAGYIPLPSCDYVFYEATSEDEFDIDVCKNATLVEIFSYLFIPWLVLVSLMLASSLQAGPAMWYQGLYLGDRDTKMNVSFGRAFTYALLHGAVIIPLFIISGYAWFEYSPPLHWQINIFILAAFFGAALELYNAFQKPGRTLAERASGAKIFLTDKAEEKVREKLQKQKRINKLTYFLAKYHIYLFIIFLFTGFMAFNVIRGEIPPPPADYQDVLYKRPAVDWERNGYFAFEGLNAPADVRNSYRFGREYTGYTAEKWSEYKRTIGLPHVDNVPKFGSMLFDPAHDYIDEKLHFDDDIAGLENWHCWYAFEWSSNLDPCPDIQRVEDLIAKNRILWGRYNELNKYRYWARPDMFIDGFSSGQSLISLSQLDAAYIVYLQSIGREDEAMRRWLSGVKLYKNMIGDHSTVVHKAIYMVVGGSLIASLDILLYQHPQLAVKYKKDLQKALLFNGLSDFKAGYFLADEWRQIGTIFLTTMDWSNYTRRQLYKCFQEDKKLAALPAHEFPFTDYEHCPWMTEMTESFGKSLLAEFLKPGNPMSNVILGLLMPGILKGHELKANMHYQIAGFRMGLVAIELIENNVAPENVPDYLTTLPENLQNPITRQPFAWNKEKQMLYFYRHGYEQVDGNETAFHVNLMK